MKNLLTLTLICMAMVAVGQGKPKIENSVSGSIFSIMTIDPNKSDTTLCWFKEVIIDSASRL